MDGSLESAARNGSARADNLELHAWQAMAALLSWKAGGGADALGRLRRIAERRLPALDARRAELTEAVEAAAG